MVKIAFAPVAQTACGEQVLPVEYQVWLNRFGVVMFDFVIRGQAKNPLAICAFSTGEREERVAQSLHSRLRSPSNLSAFAQAVCPAGRPSCAVLNERFRLTRPY